MIYSVTFEVMHDTIGEIVVRTISVSVDAAGDAWTQINRAVCKLHPRAKIVEYTLEEEDIQIIPDYFC